MNSSVRPKQTTLSLSTGGDPSGPKIGLQGLIHSFKERPLSVAEKKFLLCAERGDAVSVKALLEKYVPIKGDGAPVAQVPPSKAKKASVKQTPFDINCKDPLGRTALIIAIENENIELIELLLTHGIDPGDALLHAIAEQFVEAVELLLCHEEKIHRKNTPYSWERVDPETSTYTRDVTPLILAAHKDNYEILKLLLDRGASLPLPHDIKCGCKECVRSTSDDYLRHSRSRINAYRALCSPSLIALSSKDPVLTIFQLSYELRRLSIMEKEFKAEYLRLRDQVQDFGVSLLDHVRTNNELQIILNYDPHATESLDPDEMHLERLKLAIDYKQKKFVGESNMIVILDDCNYSALWALLIQYNLAHPAVQQLLSSCWYSGMPGFKRKSPIGQFFEVARIGTLFPFYAIAALFLPNSTLGKQARKPFIKFINHSASYLIFLLLLVVASQRLEYHIVEGLGGGAPQWLKEMHHKQRGRPPTLTEYGIILYVLGFIWQELQQMAGVGLIAYISDMWNVVDSITNIFYVNWIVLRTWSYIEVYMEETLTGRITSTLPREQWDTFDPMLLSESMFGAANILSFLKLVHIFSVHPQLGPLQISLGRMVFDIIKFFFIYTLVLFAFGCGLNQLLWYYSSRDKERCAFGHLQGVTTLDQDHSCTVWRRFNNLFETSQSLFWASFGLIDLQNFELSGIKEFTRFWALLTFGSYSVINVVVLLNLLIAMMSNSYQRISERSDVEWKFARSKLWISFFDVIDTPTVPPPFNIVPHIGRCCQAFGQKLKSGFTSETAMGNINQQLYENIMRCLVRRYVTHEQRRQEATGPVTQDDTNEIKQDIAGFRYELFDVLRKNGMISKDSPHDMAAFGRKERIRERRLLKGFNIGVVEKMFEDQAMSDGQYREIMIPTNDARDARKKSFAQRRRSSVLSRLSTGSGGSLRRRQIAQQRWAAAITLAREHADPIGKASETRHQSVSDLRAKVMKEEEMVTEHSPSRVGFSEPDIQEAAAREATQSQESQSMPASEGQESKGSEPREEKRSRSKVDLHRVSIAEETKSEIYRQDEGPAEKSDGQDVEEEKAKGLSISRPASMDQPDNQEISEPAKHADESSGPESSSQQDYEGGDEEEEEMGGGDPLSQVTVIPRDDPPDEPSKKWF